MNKLLEVRDLQVAYGKVTAVAGVNIDVAEGQIVTVIGPNGAGKTTLLSAIMGVLPSRGAIHFGGLVRKHAEIEEMVASGMGLVPEKRELFAEMSVEDNLILGGFHRYRTGERDQSESLREVYDLFPRLKERENTAAGVLSGGEQQMLTLCRALMGDPDLILIDEPTEGLAPRLVALVGEYLQALKERGISVLLVEQKLAIALDISQRVYVMGHGSIVFEGTPAELKSNAQVRKEWLEV